MAVRSISETVVVGAGGSRTRPGEIEGSGEGNGGGYGCQCRDIGRGAEGRGGLGEYMGN